MEKETQATTDGLYVHVKDDDVWLLFEASDGKSAIVSASSLVHRYAGTIAGEAVARWVADRRAALSKATPSSPANDKDR